MKNFKEMLDRDLDSTFYNTAEFAEIHKIKYDGIEKNIPLIFDLEEAKERKITEADHGEGIHREITVVRSRLSDLTKKPRHGARFWIDSELFKVLSVEDVYNELIIELERFDE